MPERCATPADKTKDGRERDPIGTIGRARETLSRVRQLKDAPPEWFNGTLEEYRSNIESAVLATYPALKDETEEALAAAAFDYFALDTKNFSKARGPGAANRFKKDVLRVGLFDHPSQKEPVAFDANRIKNLVANTNTLIEKGVKVPCPLRHSNDPLANVGFWEKFEVGSDGAVTGTLRVEDETILPKIGKTLTDVSVRIAPNVKVGGAVLDEAFDHVCITSYPVVNGQKNFEPASLGLSRDSGPALYAEKRTVDPLAKLKAKLNLSADATEEDVEKALDAAQAAATKATDLEKKLADKATAEETLLERVERLESEKIDAEANEMLSKDLINKRQFDLYKAILKAKDGKGISLDKDGKAVARPLADLVREFAKASTPVTFDLSRRMSEKSEPTELDKDEIKEANRLAHLEADDLVRKYTDHRAEWSKDADGRESFTLVKVS